MNTLYRLLSESVIDSFLVSFEKERNQYVFSFRKKIDNIPYVQNIVLTEDRFYILDDYEDFSLYLTNKFKAYKKDYEQRFKKRREL